MTLKVIQRGYPIVVKVNMYQTGQVDGVQGGDFIPLQINLLEVGEGIGGH
jgi:hypothetical protein